MNTSLRATLLLTGFCLLLCSVAKSKDYAIEVIFFIDKNALSQTAEQFPVDRIIPAPDNGLNLFAEHRQNAQAENQVENWAENQTENSNSAQINATTSHLDDTQADTSIWQALPREQYILDKVADKLKRSGRYRILKHIAWRQPMVDKNQAKAIQIYAGGDFSELFPQRAYRRVEFGDTMPPLDQDRQISNPLRELAGTVRVVITRYLHVYTDLVYRLPGTHALALEDARQRQQVLVDYAINSHRRMRSRELHYIDHPLLGILVEATPIEENQRDQF